jgi:hypothetical protein
VQSWTVAQTSTCQMCRKFVFGFSICSHATFILTLILLTWKIWWAPNNVSRWHKGFNSAFKELIVEFHVIPTEISCLTSLIITTLIPKVPLRCGASYWHSVQPLTLPCSWWVQPSTFSGSLISSLVQKVLSNLHRRFMTWMCIWTFTMNGYKVK